MTEPQSLHRTAGDSSTTSPTIDDRIDNLISDIASTLERIRIFADEYTHQSNEMLGELDNPSQSLLDLRDVISTAFAAIGALDDRAAGLLLKLEQLIGQAHRGK